MEITLQPGEDKTLSLVGFGFYVVNASGPLKVELREIDAQVDQSAVLMPGQGLQGVNRFEGVRVKNLHDEAQTVEIYVGPRAFIDNRTVGDIAVSGGVVVTNVLTPVTIANPTALTAAAPHTVAAVPAVHTIAADTARRYLMLKAAPANAGVIWIGGTAGQGIPIFAGETVVLSGGHEVEMIGDTTGDILYSMSQEG